MTGGRSCLHDSLQDLQDQLSCTLCLCYSTGCLVGVVCEHCFGRLPWRGSSASYFAASLAALAGCDLSSTVSVSSPILLARLRIQQTASSHATHQHACEVSAASVQDWAWAVQSYVASEPRGAVTPKWQTLYPMSTEAGCHWSLLWVKGAFAHLPCEKPQWVSLDWLPVFERAQNWEDPCRLPQLGKDHRMQWQNLPLSLPSSRTILPPSHLHTFPCSMPPLLTFPVPRKNTANWLLYLQLATPAMDLLSHFCDIWHLFTPVLLPLETTGLDSKSICNEMFTFEGFFSSPDTSNA